MQAIYSNAARFTTLNNLCDQIIMVAVVFTVVLYQALHSDKKGKFLVILVSLGQSHAILHHILISRFSHVTFLRYKLVNPKLLNIGTILEATVYITMYLKH